MVRKVLAVLVSVMMLMQQSGFTQAVPQVAVPAYLQGLVDVQQVRPAVLRAIDLPSGGTDYEFSLDSGSGRTGEEVPGKLIEYFKTGLVLPNSSFWVNLRPDQSDEIIDPYLERTDLGKVLLEADLQLKKDISRFTSPETKEGKLYWTRLYEKIDALCGDDEVMDIPTMTRPWIVPGEIILVQSPSGVHIYKAALKVMLEQDYLAGKQEAVFSDPRMKEINNYSCELIKQFIIPRLNREVNSAAAYAQLRQVYYSLILAQWFKATVWGQEAGHLTLVCDSKNLTGLTSKKSWSKQTYFKAYQKSFAEGEYYKEETVSTRQGPVVRKYCSGGTSLGIAPGQVTVLSGVAPVYSGTRILSELVLDDPSLNDGGIAELKKELGLQNHDLLSRVLKGIDQLEKIEEKGMELFNESNDWIVDWNPKSDKSSEIWKSVQQRAGNAHKLDDGVFKELVAYFKDAGVSDSLKNYALELKIRASIASSEDVMYMAKVMPVTVVPFEYIVHRMVGSSPRQYPGFALEHYRAMGFSMTEAENPASSRQSPHTHPLVERTNSGSDSTEYIDYNNLVEELSRTFNFDVSGPIANALLEDLLYELHQLRKLPELSGLDNDELFGDYTHGLKEIQKRIGDEKKVGRLVNNLKNKVKGFGLKVTDEQVVRDIWSKVNESQLSTLEDKYSKQVSYGEMTLTPPKYPHTIRNGSDEVSSIDWTLKDLFLQLFKSSGGSAVNDTYEILPPVVKKGDGWEINRHVLEDMIASVKRDSNGKPIFDKDANGQHNPVAKKTMNVEFSLMSVEEGKTTPKIPFKELYSGVQILRLMPWPKHLSPGWDMQKERKSIKAKVTLFLENGKKEPVEVHGGSQIVLNNRVAEGKRVVSYQVENTSDNSEEIMLVTASKIDRLRAGIMRLRRNSPELIGEVLEAIDELENYEVIQQAKLAAPETSAINFAWKTGELADNQQDWDAAKSMSELLLVRERAERSHALSGLFGDLVDLLVKNKADDWLVKAARELQVRAMIASNEDVMHAARNNAVTVVPFEYVNKRGDRQYPAFSLAVSRALGFSMTEAENAPGLRQEQHSHPFTERTNSGSALTQYVDYNTIISILSDQEGFNLDSDIAKTLSQDVLYELTILSEDGRLAELKGDDGRWRPLFDDYTNGLKKVISLLGEKDAKKNFVRNEFDKKVKGLGLSKPVADEIFDMWRKVDIKKLEDQNSVTVNFGEMTVTMPGYSHMIRNGSDVIPSVDWTLKDLFLQIFKLTGGKAVEGMYKISPPAFKRVHNNRQGKEAWTEYWHSMSGMVPTIKWNADGTPYMEKDAEGNYNPVPSGLIDVVYNMLTVKPGAQTDTRPFIPLSPDVQVIRLMPWPKGLKADWDMSKEREDIRAEVYIHYANGDMDPAREVVGGGQIALNNKNAKNPIVGYSIRNISRNPKYEIIVVTAGVLNQNFNNLLKYTAWSEGELISNLVEWQKEFKEKLGKDIAIEDMIKPKNKGGQEFFEIIDEKDGSLTGAIKPRSLVHIDGDWHRDIRVLFVDKEKEEVFIQYRDANNDIEANTYAESTGGHLDLGEDYDAAAIREVKEELNIEVDPDRLIKIGRFTDHVKGANNSLNNSHYKLYVYLVNSQERNNIKVDVSDGIGKAESGFRKIAEVSAEAANNEPGFTRSLYGILVRDKLLDSITKDEKESGDTKDGGGRKVGGIDMRALSGFTQTVSAIALPAVPAELLNADSRALAKQWQDIQAKMQAGAVPYDQLKVYVAACCQRQECRKQLSEVSDYIATVLQLEESAAVESSTQMKEIVACLVSG